MADGCDSGQWEKRWEARIWHTHSNVLVRGWDGKGHKKSMRQWKKVRWEYGTLTNIAMHWGEAGQGDKKTKWKNKARSKDTGHSQRLLARGRDWQWHEKSKGQVLERTIPLHANLCSEGFERSLSKPSGLTCIMTCSDFRGFFFFFDSIIVHLGPYNTSRLWNYLHGLWNK